MYALTEYEKGFLEGLIDSEGCFAHYKTLYMSSHTITISNTNLNLLLKAQKITGGSLYPVVSKSRSSDWRTLWSLHINRKDWKHWLGQIVLIEKETKRQEFLMRL